MYKVVVSDQCGCYRKSNLENNLIFESKEKARQKALEMQEYMNNNFCQKHSFEAQEMFDNFVIKFFKEEQQEPSCCGSGCCM